MRQTVIFFSSRDRVAAATKTTSPGARGTAVMHIDWPERSPLPRVGPWREWKAMPIPLAVSLVVGVVKSGSEIENQDFGSVPFAESEMLLSGQQSGITGL